MLFKCLPFLVMETRWYGTKLLRMLSGDDNVGFKLDAVFRETRTISGTELMKIQLNAFHKCKTTSTI